MLTISRMPIGLEGNGKFSRAVRMLPLSDRSAMGLMPAAEKFVLATAGGWCDALFTFHSLMALPCFVVRFLTGSVVTVKRRPAMKTRICSLEWQLTEAC